MMKSASEPKTKGRLAPAGATLLLIGGAEVRGADSEILKRFLEISGGEKARLIICGAATAHAEEVTQEYAEVFGSLGAAQMHREAFQERSAGEAESLVAKLGEATGVFFTGGDQLQITSLVAGTRFGDLLRQRLEEGTIVLAGTSAGAAAMSATMIVGGPSHGTVRRSDVDLAPGLGYWPDAVIDTHFNQRGRVSRLLTVFSNNPQIMGIGIDEDTAVEYRPASKEFHVLGSGVVTVVHGPIEHSNAPLASGEEPLAILGARLHTLPHGYRFDVGGQQPHPPLATAGGSAASSSRDGG